MNVLKTKVSLLPSEQHNYIVDISRFKQLQFYYHNKAHYTEKLSHDHYTNEAKYQHMVILKSPLYDDCIVIRDVNTKTFTVDCTLYSNHNPGMQLIACESKGYIFLIPNWNDDISFIMEDALAYIPELAGLCPSSINSESIEILPN